MISVEEAKSRIKKNSLNTKPCVMDLDLSIDLYTAEDVYAPISLPPFNQSAMDGYALGKCSAGNRSKKFKLVGEIKAGDTNNYSIKEDQALRIFTGAMVPSDALCVVMQENTIQHADGIEITQTITEKENIRPLGEQIQKGQLALKKDTQLKPAAIGFLKGMGLTKIRVYPRPKIGLIITGNELVQAGNPIQMGQIFESNSSTLLAALRKDGYHDIQTVFLKDNLQDTINSIKAMLIEMDCIILSGGISVGDYDFVGEALKTLAVEEIFYKVNQKPGKPIFFGKKAACLVFALPGNPSASLLCYYQYVQEALRHFYTKCHKENVVLQMPIASDYIKKGNRAHFLKAIAHKNDVEILHGQSSAMLHSFALANALIYIPEAISEVKKGTMVSVFMLPE